MKTKIQQNIDSKFRWDFVQDAMVGHRRVVVGFFTPLLYRIEMNFDSKAFTLYTSLQSHCWD